MQAFFFTCDDVKSKTLRFAGLYLSSIWNEKKIRIDLIYKFNFVFEYFKNKKWFYLLNSMGFDYFDFKILSNLKEFQKNWFDLET